MAAMKDIALQYCDRLPLIHMDMSETIRRGHAEIKYAAADGLIIYNPLSQVYLFSATDVESAKRLCGLLPEGMDVVVVRGPGTLQAVIDRYGFTGHSTCFQAAYLGKEKLPVELDGEEIRPLEKRFIPLALEHYRLHDRFEYFEERIDAGEMFGLFKEGTDIFMGFIGMHDDGSGGMLEILPEYRRHGLGSALEAFLINFQLDKGYIPYGQIFSDNESSIALQKKLGLQLSTEILHWVY